ncbi:MAG: hypothetical protein ABSE92_09425 [Terriglobales bacterium]|jgi:uncharacterized protein involved in exopolysaccharide biosynthesis
MAEELKLIPRPTQAPAPTTRDVMAVFFRQKKTFWRSFAAIFGGVLLYGLLFPSYKAEMKILLRRARIDAMAAPTPSQSPQITRDEVTEEELNSEAEMLTDADIVRTAAQTSGLADKQPWIWQAIGENQEQHLARTVRRLLRKLDVQPGKRANVIDVSYTSSDPERSARVLSSLAQAYLERHEQIRRPVGEFDFFDRQMAQARANLERAEAQLLDFTHAEGVVSAATERDSTLQQFSQTDAENEQTKVSLAETAERVRTLQSKLQSLPERTTTQTKNADNPQLLEKMKSKLLELRLQRTELLTKYGASYRLVREVDEQIAQASAALTAEDQLPLREQTVELDANHEWAKSELLKAQVTLNDLSARSNAATKVLSQYRETARNLNDRAIQQQDLLQNLKTAEDEYVLYANKREEARIADALDERGILNVAIAQEPSVPALPIHSAAVWGLFALLAGGIFSTSAAFAVDYANPRFRTPDEVAGYLGMPVLASLPRRSY